MQHFVIGQQRPRRAGNHARSFHATAAVEHLEPRVMLRAEAADLANAVQDLLGGCGCGCGGGATATVQDISAESSHRPNPDMEDHGVLFRLPLAQDTTLHYYFDRDPGPGRIAWNGTTQTYNGHRGTDYSRIARNTPVYAAADGILIAKDDGHPDFGGPPNGNYVRLNHGNDRNGNPINSVYLHLNAGTVTTKPIGSFIAAGEYLGGVGTSGNSTGLHLHFEVQVSRVAFDPYKAVWSDEEVSWWVDQGTGSPSTATPPPRFVAGDVIEVFALTTSNLNVRWPQPTSSSIGTQPNGAIGTVLDGPALSYIGSTGYNNNLYTRYLVEFDDGMKGWVAQNWIRLAPDTTPPEVLVGSFEYESLPQRLSFSFSEDVGPSLSVASLSIQNVHTGSTFGPGWLAYNSATDTAVFGFHGILADGVYRATLHADGVHDAAGNPMAADHVLDFFMLAGDASRDGRVDVADLGILAANWQKTGMTFSQGDFNYDGIVDVADLGILAVNWQESLDLTLLNDSIVETVDAGLDVEAAIGPAKVDRSIATRQAIGGAVGTREPFSDHLHRPLVPVVTLAAPDRIFDLLEEDANR